MRVLTILHRLTLGGIQTTLLHCLPRLKERGVQIVMACTGPEAELDGAYRDMGVTIYRLPRYQVPEPAALAVRKLRNRHPVDILHSRYGYKSGATAWARIGRESRAWFLFMVSSRRHLPNGPCPPFAIFRIGRWLAITAHR